VLGGAIVWFLAVPATKQDIHADANKQVTDANTKMSQQVALVQGLEEQIESYQLEVELANKNMEDANERVESYDQLLEAATIYLTGDQAGAAEALSEIIEEDMTGKGETLYNSLNMLLQDYVFTEAVEKGDSAYMRGEYEAAITEYSKAVAANGNDYHAIYYLAWAYRNTGDTANADKYFKEALLKFPAKESEIAPFITKRNSTGDDQTGEAQ